MRLPRQASIFPTLLWSFFALLLSLPAIAAIGEGRVFGYAEANYPGLFSGTPSAGQASYLGREYSYQYYPGSNNYLAIDSSGFISILGDATDGDLIVVGSVSAFESTITVWENSAGRTGTTGADGTMSYQEAYDACYVGTPPFYTGTYCAAYANAIVAGSTPLAANQAGATAAGYTVVGTIGMGETTTTGTGSTGGTVSYQTAYDACYVGTPLLYTGTYCAAYANAIVAGSTPAAANQAGAAAAGSNVGNIGMGQIITATGTPYSSASGSTSMPTPGGFPANYADRARTDTEFFCPATPATSTVPAFPATSMWYSVVEGPCQAVDTAWYQIDACRTASASVTVQADIAHTVCWANNSLDPYRTRYVNNANYSASQYGLRQPTYNFLPDFYFVAGAATGGSGTSGTGTSGTGTSTGGGTDACSTQTYVGGANDPQVDTFCQIAQFDACMYAATGNAAYNTDKSRQCTVLNGLLPYLSTTWSCRYCP